MDRENQRESNKVGNNNGWGIQTSDDEDPNQKNRESKEQISAEEQELIISTERDFENQVVPSWRNQLTVRAFVVSFVLSVLFCFIVMKLNLTTGIIPSLNVSAGFLGFFFVKTWTKFLEKAGMLKQPFTRQENTVIQTCVVASSGIAFSGGFGSYLFAMSAQVANQSSDINDVKNPELAWIIGFLFVVSYLGLFSVVPLRKIMIIDFKLTYPSGTATANLINGFQTPEGSKLAKKQVRKLGQFFSFSFLWGFFKWFYTAEEGCGFASFPSLGLEALKNKFYFDFSTLYVGLGMICPYSVNISLLLGGILSWGIMWPLIEKQKGNWFSVDNGVDNAASVRGLYAYKVFISIALILGDGLYNFCKVLGKTLLGLYAQLQHKATHRDLPSPPSTYDDECRTIFFLKDQIPTWFAAAAYVTIAAISTATLPHIIPQLEWYYIIVIYILAPSLAFCNAYGCGLTDWSLATTYGKLAIFTIGALAGSSHDGVLASLAACGVMMNIVSTASDLTQDFKTGYLTLASPRAMFVSQIIGTTMGCIISPCVFWLFYKAFDDLRLPDSQFSAPNPVIFRNMALLGVEGLSSLPKYCLLLCCIFYAAAIVINLIKDLIDKLSGKKLAQYIPIPMAMAITFYQGSYFAIDMCVGSLILFIWRKRNKHNADAFAGAVASGLICGDGIWALPATILALVGVKPPICMKFLSRARNAKVDGFLSTS